LADFFVPAPHASYFARIKRANAATNSRFLLEAPLEVEL